MNTFYNYNDQVLAAISGLTSPDISDLKSKTLLPKGSGLRTSSGHLAPNISAIYHAATGTMNSYFPALPLYEPTLQSVEDSIQACFSLAKIFGSKRLAMPYIGGSIFKNRIFKGMGLSEKEKNERLVKTIVDATIQFADEYKLDYCFVAFDDEAYTCFTDELKTRMDDKAIAVYLVQGDITDFSLHQCDGIINAANMEVQFGGGISGAIARATQDSVNIDKEASLAIQNFWKAYEN